MSWSLPTIEHDVFPRNPLLVVVAQLRYHPVLKVADRLADFQDAVRGRFPAFQKRSTQTVEFRAPTGVSIREEQQFVFLSADGRSTLFLTPTALGLDCRDHRHRDELQADFDLATNALLAIHKAVDPTRLGLRYVNAIHRERVSADLGRQVPWEELVTEGFRRVAGGVALDDDTQFATEVTSSVVPNGHLTARCALVSPPGAMGQEFRLDFDRFTEAGIRAEAVGSLLTTFADDIYNLFRSASGPALVEWMKLGAGTELGGR